MKKAIITAGVLAALSLPFAATANAAPGYTSFTDAQICARMDASPSPGGIAGLGLDMMHWGLTSKETADQLVHAVQYKCPEHMNDLVAFANAFGGNHATV